jgi:hypothetical protein
LRFAGLGRFRIAARPSLNLERSSDRTAGGDNPESGDECPMRMAGVQQGM